MSLHRLILPPNNDGNTAQFTTIIRNHKLISEKYYNDVIIARLHKLENPIPLGGNILNSHRPPWWSDSPGLNLMLMGDS